MTLERVYGSFGFERLLSPAVKYESRFGFIYNIGIIVGYGIWLQFHGAIGPSVHETCRLRVAEDIAIASRARISPRTRDHQLTVVQRTHLRTLYIYIYIHTYNHMYTYIYIYMDVLYSSIYIYMYLCIYIHTHIFLHMYIASVTRRLFNLQLITGPSLTTPRSSNQIS